MESNGGCTLGPLVQSYLHTLLWLDETRKLIYLEKYILDNTVPLSVLYGSFTQ